ncbi:anionic trypsin-like [Anomaloglossus baeobatrachus]
MVRLGRHSIDNPEETEQIISAKKKIPHPNYNSFLIDNDIMLVKLSQAAKFNNRTQSISLPTNGIVPGTECVISRSRNILSDGVRATRVKVSILPDLECKAAFPGHLTENVLCGGLQEDVLSPCLGDTGDPVVCNEELRGIMSFNIGCPLIGRSVIFIRVSKYLQWIEETISNN